MENNHLFKLLLIGNELVGKSNLLIRFSEDAFTESYIPTIGVDFRIQMINVDNKTVKLQIWDTAGQERFRSITNSYYNGSNAIIIVFDVNNQNSFDDIENRIKDIENWAQKNTQLFLIGNKCDIQSNSKIDSQVIQNYAQERNMLYFETSAKTGYNVKEAFQQITKILIDQKEYGQTAAYQSSSTAAMKNN